MSPARIGLVLGAGGVAGHAFHAGVLAALAEALGWDARSAEVVVGTSAGSGVGAILRAGLPPGDVFARAVGEPMSPAGARLLAHSPRPYSPPAPQAPGRLAMAAPRVLVRAALRPWNARLGALAAGVLPAGRIPTEMISGYLRPLFGPEWPAGLELCAVRLDDGRRVVFGRPGEPRAEVPDAVAASCAIPGYYAPVTIDGVRYVDGGAHSPTNADLVAGRGLDLVVVSSPMSAAGRRPQPTADVAVRRWARAQLWREAAQVRRRGTPVVAFQPTEADQRAAGPNAMDPRRRADVARQARTSALARLERADVRERLAALCP